MKSLVGFFGVRVGSFGAVIDGHVRSGGMRLEECLDLDISFWRMSESILIGNF